MLKALFSKAHSHYLTLPILGPILDDFSDRLLAHGYQPSTRRMHITRMVGVDAYLYRQGRKTIDELTPEDLQAWWQWYKQHQVHAAGAVRLLHHYLDDQNCLPELCPQPPATLCLLSGEIYPVSESRAGIGTAHH
jgi:hypothetical protein